MVVNISLFNFTVNIDMVENLNGNNFRELINF
jgi:hypothetical protein